MARKRLTPEERSEVMRRNVEVRWARHRAARLAAGLPATRQEEIGRRPSRHTDPEVRAYWVELVKALGLDVHEAESRGVEQLTTRQLDRLALALSESETRRLAETPARAGEASDNRLEARIAFHTSQAAQWEFRARQERAIAAEHDRYAADHEQALADLLMRGLE